jgi:hypothetical protein
MSSWLKMYPGMGFVVTTRPEFAQKVLEIFQKRGFTAATIGKVTKERQLVIRSGSEEKVLFDLEKECVTGIR